MCWVDSFINDWLITHHVWSALHACKIRACVCRRTQPISFLELTRSCGLDLNCFMIVVLFFAPCNDLMFESFASFSCPGWNKGSRLFFWQTHQFQSMRDPTFAINAAVLSAKATTIWPILGPKCRTALLIWSCEEMQKQHILNAFCNMLDTILLNAVRHSRDIFWGQVGKDSKSTCGMMHWPLLQNLCESCWFVAEWLSCSAQLDHAATHVGLTTACVSTQIENANLSFWPLVCVLRWSLLRSCLTVMDHACVNDWTDRAVAAQLQCPMRSLETCFALTVTAECQTNDLSWNISTCTTSLQHEFMMHCAKQTSGVLAQNDILNSPILVCEPCASAASALHVQVLFSHMSVHAHSCMHVTWEQRDMEQCVKWTDVTLTIWCSVTFLQLLHRKKIHGGKLNWCACAGFSYSTVDTPKVDSCSCSQCSALQVQASDHWPNNHQNVAWREEKRRQLVALPHLPGMRKETTRIRWNPKTRLDAPISFGRLIFPIL